MISCLPIKGRTGAETHIDEEEGAPVSARCFHLPSRNYTACARSILDYNGNLQRFRKRL
jgi:hypothetical protein